MYRTCRLLAEMLASVQPQELPATEQQRGQEGKKLVGSRKSTCCERTAEQKKHVALTDRSQRCWRQSSSRSCLQRSNREAKKARNWSEAVRAHDASRQLSKETYRTYRLLTEMPASTSAQLQELPAAEKPTRQEIGRKL